MISKHLTILELEFITTNTSANKKRVPAEVNKLCILPLIILLMSSSSFIDLVKVMPDLALNILFFCTLDIWVTFYVNINTRFRRRVHFSFLGCYVHCFYYILITFFDDFLHHCVERWRQLPELVTCEIQLRIRGFLVMMYEEITLNC